MTPRNIASVTREGHAPQFISINRVGDTAVVEITVRGPATADGTTGPIAMMTMTASTLDVFARQILASLAAA